MCPRGAHSLFADERKNLKARKDVDADAPTALALARKEAQTKRDDVVRDKICTQERRDEEEKLSRCSSSFVALLSHIGHLGVVFSILFVNKDDGDVAVEDATNDHPKKKSRTGKEFVGCNDDKDGNEDDEDEKEMDAKDFVLRSIETTRVRSKPFASYVHLCRVFPRKLYREMTEYFPPKEALAPAKLTSHKLRYKIDRVGSLLDLPEAMKKTFKNFTKTVEVWSKAEDILLSERLRETVFRKLEVDEVEKKTRSKDFRIQVDVGGFTLGPHPDSPKKIVTLMLYFPKEEEEESNKKLFGTCLYTKEQYETFADNDEGKEVLPSCEKKFLFEPNTGYAFKVGEESYHGVDDIPPRCERRTLLINWYSTSKPVGSQSGIFPNIWDIIRGDA